MVQFGHGSLRDTKRFLDQLATTPMALTNIKETQRIIGLASESHGRLEQPGQCCCLGVATDLVFETPCSQK